MQPIVSIIVPVYNTESTLRRCVDSILEQEFTDFELLLVDDGSRDDSGPICDEYAARDSRIQAIHKENGGVSSARNLALDRARGVYLQFLDSDDWITPDATISLVRAAENRQCDLVISDFYRVVGERVSRKGDIDDAVLSREEYATHMMENPADFYYGVLWNKLYRRDIVETHHLRMDPEISWCEDFMFNLEYIRHAQRFYALQVPIYYYVKTKGSLATSNISISRTIKMKLMVFEYYQRFFKSVLDEEEYEKSRLKVYRFLVDAAGDGVVPPAVLPNSQRLGSERMRIAPDILAGDGVLSDTFRDRKLLDYYLETAALKNGLSLDDARLLLALEQLSAPCTRRELADFAGVSRGGLTLALQRFTGKGLIRIEEVRQSSHAPKRLSFVFLPEACGLLDDLRTAQEQYRSARYAGLSQEDLAQYRALAGRIRENIQSVLQ
ncbi:glycosyltransferase [uncultured Dysosmobacter sp.]|uniref:glycosyltransferase n=1 Tax=uncultured Dysosmobacter sp. TaxID=2591384 RepID=UPI002606AB58|nr:glycosyltransferase [uncultured Dysosmobacter sp.]